MKTFLAFGLFMIMTTAAGAIEPKATLSAAVNHRPTKPETATTPAAKHTNLAAHFRTEADKNDALGAAYEQAAGQYRRGPFIKNLMSPTTPGRYEFLAGEYHDKAKTDRVTAQSHEQKAKASAGF